MRKKSYKKRFSKFERALLSVVFLSIVFFFVYKYLLIVFFYMCYDGFCFAYNGHYYSIIFFLGVIILEVIHYYSDDRRMKRKKYLILSFILSTFVFVIIFIVSSSTWIFTEDRIIYQDLFSSNEICYEYDDIEKAVLYYDESTGIKMRGVSPSYDIIMKDGEEISVCLFESYYTSYESLIGFDKRLSLKRDTKGAFIHLHIDEELNNYYEGVFN